MNTEMKIIKSIRAEEDTRFVFNGIYYSEKEEVVATDGRMMVVAKDPALFVPNLKGCILEPESLTLIDGSYPDYEGVYNHAVSSATKEFTFSFPNQTKLPNHPVWLYSKEDGVLKVSITEEFKGSIVAQVNGKYLNKLFLKVGKEVKTLKIKANPESTNSPLHIKIQGYENLFFVLMPMKYEKK